MTREELLCRITARELVEWMAYYELEPWGEERADLRAAIVASTIANIFRGKRAAYKVEDFMPEFGRRAKSPNELLKLAEMLNATLGGSDRRGNRQAHSQA